MGSCLFCKIVKGEVPSHKIWEDKNFLAILSIFPNTDGYTVVMSKKHLPSYIFENGDGVISSLMQASKKVAKILDNTFPDVKRTGVFFEGFGVDHLHAKLFPMHGTNIPNWKPIKSGLKMKKFFKKYPGYLSSNDSLRADDKKLLKLTDKIRITAKKLKA